MAKDENARSARRRGSIDELPSGALRVRVYAGVDPVTKRRHDLIEIVPPGPHADRKARALRDRLVAQVSESRNPRTSATVDQLLDKYLDQLDGAPNTLTLYRGYVRNHISPFLGDLKVGQLDAEALDSFYAELRRCRKHCTGRRSVEHRGAGPHECDHHCGPHRCRPLSPTTVRHMHFILSGAFKRAVRWRWVSANPLGQAEPPAAPKPNPAPPTPAEAARILNEAWRDPDWGTFLWVAMTTGARRGELCAVRWSSVSLDEGRESIWLRRAIRKEGSRLVEAELKTHQQRRLALDPETVAVLREQLARCRARAVSLGHQLQEDALVFSGAPDGATFPKPDAMTQRYERLADRLGIDTTLHRLRHYSATELITGGVDVRTVAGRLGHAGGGTTTLRTYTAWVSEVDQRAAVGLGAGMPRRPVEVEARLRARTDPRSPYEVVAVQLARSIELGDLEPGEPAPTANELVTQHGVSISTARRAVALVKEWGLLVNDSHGRPRVAVAQAEPVPDSPEPVAVHQPVPTAEGSQFWSVVVRGPDGVRSAPRLVNASLDDPESFRGHLVGIALAEVPTLAPDAAWIGDYEIEVRDPRAAEPAAILRWG